MSALRDAIRAGLPRFPPELGIQVSIGECELDANGHIFFRKCRWVPDDEPLCMRIMQDTHDSPLSGCHGAEMLASCMACLITLACLA